MDGLDKVEKTLIVTLVVSVAAMLFLMGVSVYSYWYVGTHHATAGGHMDGIQRHHKRRGLTDDVVQGG